MVASRRSFHLLTVLLSALPPRDAAPQPPPVAPLSPDTPPAAQAGPAVDGTLETAIRLLSGPQGEDTERGEALLREFLKGPHRERARRALESAWDDPEPALRRRVRRLSCETLIAEAPLAPDGGGNAAARVRMVERQIFREGVEDPRVIRAMLRVPREEFVPESERPRAYADDPLPIGDGQTISQPYIVAYMTEALGLRGDEKVLEVGTGSGYQAAVLAHVAREVYTIEIVDTLARRAADTFQRLKVANVRARVGDGHRGWPEAAPFDAVIVTCAPDRIPPLLVEQLREGGRIVIPVGGDPDAQQLVRVTKTAEGLRRENLLPVRFVPMTGEAERR